MALEESLAADAVGAADERAGPALDVRQHPLAHGVEIFGEFELGHRAAVARIRPQHLVGVGDRDAQSSARLRASPGASVRRTLGSMRVSRRDCRTGPMPQAAAVSRLRPPAAGLSSRSPLKAAWRMLPPSGPAGELDLGHQLRLHPMDPAPRRDGDPPCERDSVARQLLQPGQQLAHLRRAEAGADAADMAPVAHRDTPRRSASGSWRPRRPAADHHLMAGAALRLDPASAAARPIGRSSRFETMPSSDIRQADSQHRVAGAA